MPKNVSPTASVVDLAAFRGRRHEDRAAEAAGRLLFDQLVAEVDDDLRGLIE